MAAVFMTGSVFGHVSLTAPSGGETLNGNASFTVKWTADDHDCKYNVYFSPDSGKTWQNIVLNLPKASRQHTWVVPNQATSQGMIRVFQDNETGSDLEGKSKVFKIQGTSGIRSVNPSAGNAILRVQSGKVDFAFDLIQASQVVLQAFNAQGRLEATLTDGRREAGAHRLSFFSNRLLSAGPLVFQLRMGDRVHAIIPASAE